MRASEIPYVCLPHDRVVAAARPRRGETIRAFVDRTGWQRRGLPVVCAEVRDGKSTPVMQAEWAGRKITKRDRFVFIAAPLGGNNGRSIGALLAMIAVIALASFLTAGPGGMVASSAFGKMMGASGLKILAAVVVAGGSFLVSHFLSPKTPKDRRDTDPLSISFGGNQARPQQPIPVHYGRLKFFPDYASAPWTDYRGSDQVFHGLYSLGIGEFDIHEIGFGTTPVWTSAGGTSSDFPSFRQEIVGPDEPVTLFPSNVAVSTDVSGQELQNVGEYIGPFIVNAPGTVGKRLAIDLVWPGGAHWTSSSGRVDPVQTDVVVQYRYVDDSGVPINATWVTAANLSYKFLSKVAVRKTTMIDLPTSGRVQVRAARANALVTDQGTNAVAWAGARLYLEGEETRPHVTLMALEAISDKSLSAYGSQQIYVIATRRIPVWTGATWEEQATQNPIWAAVDLWHNAQYGGGQSRNEIDLATLASLAADADLRGDTFNHRFTSEMTVLEGLETILRSILAQPVYVWDRFTAIRDEERAAPRLLLTDFEIIRGSPSINYLLQDDQAADGVIVEYIEEETWMRAEVGSAATLAELSYPARVQVPGVTNRRQATLLARYLASVTRYRRVTLSLKVEAEGKLLRRGDLVRVQTEMPNTWGQAFRVDDYSLGDFRLTFHEGADWTGGPNFYVLIRTAGGVPFGPVRVTQGAAPNIAIINSVDLAAVQTQQGLVLAQVLFRPSGAEYPTVSFSEGEPQEFNGLVTGVTNAGEGRFSLDLVIDAPEVYEIDDASVPPIPPPPALALPEVPGAITGVNARLEVTGLNLTLHASWRPDPASETYTAQISIIADEEVNEVDREWSTVYSAGYDALFQASGFGVNDIYLRVRGTSPRGVHGLWTQVTVPAPALPTTLAELGFEVTAEDIANGSISGTKFASGIEPVSIVDELPNPTGYAGPLVLFNTADGKLYRYVSGTWTAVVQSSDISGQITGTQITDGAISTEKLAANSVTANEIAAGAVTADEIAANAITTGKIAAGAISTDQLAANGVTAAKMATGTITALSGIIADAAIGSAKIVNGAITSAKIGDAEVGTLKIAGEAVIIPRSVMGSAGVLVNDTTERQLATITFTLPFESKINALFNSYAFNSTGSASTIFFIVRINSADHQYHQASVRAGAHDTITIVAQPTLSAGTHTVEVIAFRPSGSGQANYQSRFLSIMGAMR